MTIDGYVHYNERTNGDRSYWLCVSYRKNKCPGRVVYHCDTMIKYTGHNHYPEWHRINHSEIMYESLSDLYADRYDNSKKPLPMPLLTPKWEDHKD